MTLCPLVYSTEVGDLHPDVGEARSLHSSSIKNCPKRSCFCVVWQATLYEAFSQAGNVAHWAQPMLATSCHDGLHVAFCRAGSSSAMLKFPLCSATVICTQASVQPGNITLGGDTNRFRSCRVCRDNATRKLWTRLSTCYLKATLIISFSLEIAACGIATAFYKMSLCTCSELSDWTEADPILSTNRILS